MARPRPALNLLDRFNARGPNALVNGKSPGQPSKLNDLQRQAIADMIERGPIPAVHGAVRWRLAATIHACSSRKRLRALISRAIGMQRGAHVPV